jgi:hypothetical protein
MDAESARIRELISEVDSLVLDQRWEEVVALRDRCRLAVQRGHQWWPAAAWAEFRMALDGPGAVAASVLDSTADRYTLGPFPEVAASTHAWGELAPHVSGTPGGAAFAHECIALGDDLRADDTFAQLPAVFDLPASLQTWEPDYGPVVYHLDRVEHQMLPVTAVPDGHRLPCRADADSRIADQVTLDALQSLVGPWAQDSNNLVEAIACSGDAMTVLDAFGLGNVTPVELTSADALRSMAWIGSSGGPTGRRRGLSSARSDLWWTVLNLTGLSDEDEPVDVASASSSLLDDLAEAVSELRWSTWGTTSGVVDGWTVRLIIEDPAERLAWGVSAQTRPRR